MNKNAAVVEDEKVLRDSVAAILTSIGYRANGFESAHQFLESVNTGEDYALCVMDIDLPGMRGDDMLVALAQENKIPNTVILFLSGLELDELETAREKIIEYYPAVDYTCKPVCAESFLDRITTLMKQGT